MVVVGPAQDASLLEEPLADVEALRPVVGQRLHRDVGVEVVVVVPPDAREAARSDALDPPQPAEPCGEGHTGSVPQTGEGGSV